MSFSACLPCNVLTHLQILAAATPVEVAGELVEQGVLRHPVVSTSLDELFETAGEFVAVVVAAGMTGDCPPKGTFFPLRVARGAVDTFRHYQRGYQT